MATEMWQRLFTLIRKEMQALLRTPQSRRLLIAPVLLQLLLFPFAATLEVKNSTLAVFNQDGGAASIELVQRLAATQAFPQVLMLHSQQDMQQVIDRQQALLAISLPQDFSRRLASGQSVTAQAIIDGRRSNSAQIAYGYACKWCSSTLPSAADKPCQRGCWCKTCTTPIWNTAGLCCPAWWPSSPPSAADGDRAVTGAGTRGRHV
jgi:hypothetical protein